MKVNTILNTQIKTNSLLKTYLHAFLLLLFFHSISGYCTTINSLKCEYLVSPLGIESMHPRFSWVLENSGYNVKQTAYWIMVSRDDPYFSSSKIVWNPGKKTTSASVNISYNGKALSSQSTYYWKVKIMDNSGTVSGWSAPQEFHTGFLNGDKLSGQWIMYPEAENRSPLFRKTYNIKMPVRSAYVYATAIGLYELYLNGRKADDRLFEPATTQYSERLLYAVYDVTDLLKKGKNVLGAWMGEGQSAFTEPPKGRFANVNMKPSPFSRPMILMELRIQYKDGTYERIVTDGTWKCSASSILFNNYYGGEDYDARLDQPGWNTAPFDESNWKKAMPGSYAGKLSSSLSQPVREGMVRDPIAVIRQDNKTIEYDFGVTIGGYWEIKLEGKAGSVVEVRGTEKCGGNRFQKPLTNENHLSWEGEHHGRYYYKNCYSRYVLNGKGVETYKPRFFFQGFRYLQVKISDSQNVKIRRVRSIETGNSTEVQGAFNCSDEYLNKLHHVSVQTFKNNFIQGVPLSNPNSEKFGWTGDVHLYSGIADYSFDLPAFWTKWLLDFSDAQQWAGESGIIPETVPEMRKIGAKTDLSWLFVYPSLLVQMHQHYQDTAIIEKHYETLKQWYLFVLSRSEGYIAKGIYGDHLIPGIHQQSAFSTPGMNRLINTAYLFRVTKIMEQMAEMLNMVPDQHSFRENAKNIYAVFNTEFYDHETKRYREKPSPEEYSYELTANLIPLQMGLVPADRRSNIVAFVKQHIQSRDFKAFTGILGTRAFIDVFQHEDRSFLYKIIQNRQFPGWGYFIDSLGASTLNQSWDGGGDYNHSMLGSIDAFFYQDILGIKMDFSNQEYPVTINPFIPEGISGAKGHVKSIYGIISSSWKKVPGEIQYEVIIPCNTEGVFKFKPASDKYELVINNTPVIKKNNHINLPLGVNQFDSKTDQKSLLLGSGKYKIILKDEKDFN